MSTCSGTWRDDHVPSDVGVLITVGGATTYVDHRGPTDRCPHASPHEMVQCLEFEPVRSGFEPPSDPPRGSRLHQITDRLWDHIFNEMDRGVSFLTLLHEHTTVSRLL